MGELFEGKIIYTKKGGSHSTVDSILPQVLKIAPLHLKIAHPDPLAPPPIPQKLETFSSLLLISIIHSHF